MTKRDSKGDSKERLEDVFQDEIFQAFVDINSFKRFACSKDGLCLNEHVLQKIVENHESSEERKRRMLNTWRQNDGKDATVKKIRELVQQYKKRDDDQDHQFVNLDGGTFGFYRNHCLCNNNKTFLGEQNSEVTGNYLCEIKLHQHNEKNLRKAKLLSSLRNHVNVVSIIHAGVFRSGLFDHIFIAMDLSWNNTVRNMLEVSERQGIRFYKFILMNLARQFSKALAFIHSKNIIHCDLKPENLLCSDDWRLIKVTNFGFSKIISTTPLLQTKKNIVHDGYHAPETYKINAQISLKSDIFSAGVTMAEIMSNGKHPFGKDQYLRCPNIIKNNNFDLSDILVPQIMNLIEQMLKTDPEKRPTAKEVLNEVSLQQSQTSFQPENPQTIPDQHLATTSTAQPSNKDQAIAIIMFNESDNHLYSYKLSTQELLRMQKYPTSGIFTAVVSGKHIYILQQKEVYQLEYSDSTAKWNKMPSMTKDFGPSDVELNGSIYICGKSDSSAAPHSTEQYDAGSDRWDRICDMNIGRRHHCVVATEDYIYSIGGGGEESVERFDEESKQWEIFKSLPRPVKEASAAVFNNRVYVADCNGVLCYDIQEKLWSEMNLWNQGPSWELGFVKILATDEQLYIVTLIDNSDSHSKTAIYLLEPETSKMTLAQMLVGSKLCVRASLAVKFQP